MTKVNKFRILGYVFCVIILGCKNNTINVHCTSNELVHSDTIENNITYWECRYHHSKNIYSTRTTKGFKNINEEIYYYPDGKIKQYAFYNPTGEQVFLRIYDKKGVLEKESGNFYCYVSSNTTNITLGDSIILDFYIASPPNTYYKLFWIDKDGRHEIDWADTVAPYQRRLTIIPKKASSYRLHHEIEFYDTVRKTEEAIKCDHIFFDVIE